MSLPVGAPGTKAPLFHVVERLYTSANDVNDSAARRAVGDLIVPPSHIKSRAGDRHPHFLPLTPMLQSPPHTRATTLSHPDHEIRATLGSRTLPGPGRRPRWPDHNNPGFQGPRPNYGPVLRCVLRFRPFGGPLLCWVESSGALPRSVEGLHRGFCSHRPCGLLSARLELGRQTLG